jgi:hypothetical protein
MALHLDRRHRTDCTAGRFRHTFARILLQKGVPVST